MFSTFYSRLSLTVPPLKYMREWVVLCFLLSTLYSLAIPPLEYMRSKAKSGKAYFFRKFNTFLARIWELRA